MLFSSPTASLVQSHNWTSMIGLIASDLSALLYRHASTIATLRSPVCPTPH